MKTLRPSIVLLLLVLFASSVHAQELSTTSYFDASTPRIEPIPGYYDFIFPVPSDAFITSPFTPPTDGRYFSQNYGPRYIGNYDNHQGIDIHGSQVISGLQYTNPPVLCMCDGIISYVSNSTAPSSGRTVRVTCDSNSLVYNSPINTHYRHLDTLYPIAYNAIGQTSGSVSVAKGDTLGLMGNTGANWTHLHFDYSSYSADWSTSATNRRYMNPNRLLDPFLYPQVLGILDRAEVELLHDWADSALFRVYWPHNQTINRFVFQNDSFEVEFDVEKVRASYAVYEPSIWAQDSLKLFPYRYNGRYSPLYYWNTVDYPAIFPASPDRDTNLTMYGYEHIPLDADTVVHVYDFLVYNVPANHDANEWRVTLSDVWGYTVEAGFYFANTDDLVNDEEIQVYPNPSSSEIRIKMPLAQAEVQIMNLAGKRIISIPDYSPESPINIEQLSAGKYQIIVQHAQGEYRSSFVKGD